MIAWSLIASLIRWPRRRRPTIPPCCDPDCVASEEHRAPSTSIGFGGAPPGSMPPGM